MRSGTEKSAAKLSGVQPSASIRPAYLRDVLRHLVRRRVVRDAHLSPADDDVGLDPVAVQVEADLRVRSDVRELPLLGSAVEEDRPVSVPEEPDRDRARPAVRRDRRQPADDRLVQPPGRPPPELGGLVEHVASLSAAQWRRGTARAHRGAHPPARADRAGRRGRLPRLRRARLDLPLARARRARLPRLGVHVNHGLRGAESDARRRVLPRDVRRRGDRRAGRPHRGRAPRPALRADRRPRASRHRAHGVRPGRDRRSTGSRPAARPAGSSARREDGVVRPLLAVWREETEAYCAANGLATRTDSSNPDTLRGLIRTEIVPLLRRLHPAAEENIRRLADERPRLPRGMEETLLELLADRDGLEGARSRAGESRPCASTTASRWSDGPVRWGPWMIESDEPGLVVRARRGRRPPRRPEQEAPGRLRRREGATGRARRLAGGRRSTKRLSPCPGSWRMHGCGWRARDEDGAGPGGRRDPDRRRRACARASPSSARRSRRTTRARTCC